MNKNTLKKSKTLQKKIKKTVGKLVKPAKKLAMLALLSACVVGCATVDQQAPQPNDQKSLQAGKSETQNVEMHNSNVYIFVGVTKIPNLGSTNLTDKIVFGESESDVGHTISVLSQAQALETSGSTETYSPANTPANTPTSNSTATPTNDIKPDVNLTYGLVSDTASGRSWIADLTDASIRGISSLLRAKKSEQMTVTHTNGQTETVTCSNGVCTTASGDKITCSGGDCSPCSDGSCSFGSCSDGSCFR